MCGKQGLWTEYAHLLVEGSDGGSVLELLDVILGLGSATLALSSDLDLALVGSRGQDHLEDLGTDDARELQEWEGWARFDDNGLETVLKHERADKLELLRSNELDVLTKTGALGQSLRVVSHNCYSMNLSSFTLPWMVSFS